MALSRSRRGGGPRTRERERARERRAMEPAETGPTRAAELSLEEELDALLPPDEYTLEGLEQLMRDPAEKAPELTPTRAPKTKAQQVRASHALLSGLLEERDAALLSGRAFSYCGPLDFGLCCAWRGKTL